MIVKTRGAAPAIAIALVLAAVSAQPETRTVTAGRAEYGQHSGFWRFHFGEGYRDLWTTPFEVEVLDLRTYAGGLTPVRQVGSMQSIGLALKGGDGRSYTFRVLDKDPTRILPPEWRTTLPAQIFQDQTAAANPGSGFVVAGLAEAAGVPYTDPVYVLMPDDSALGEFRETFAGQPGTLDEFPTGAERGGLMGATEIIATGELWKRWLDGRGFVDTQAPCARGSSTCSSATGTATTASGASCASPAARDSSRCPRTATRRSATTAGSSCATC